MWNSCHRMAPAAFFRVPCTHRMYTLRCVYRALSEERRTDRRTNGRVQRGHRATGNSGEKWIRAREIGEERRSENTVKEKKKKERKKEEGEKGDRIQGTEKERTTMFRSGEIRCWFVFEATYTGFLRTSEPRRSYLHSHRHLHRCRRRRERCIRYTLTEEQPVAPTEQKRLRGRVNAFQMHNCVRDVPTQSHHKMEYAIKQ